MPRWVGSGRRRLDAVTNVMRQPDLRRLQLGSTAFFLVDAMAMVGLSVWAFDHGGASAVGVLGLARLLPGALALPFGAWAADRFARRRVVTAVFVAMCVTQALIAIALAAHAARVRRVPPGRRQQRRRDAVPLSAPRDGPSRRSHTGRAGGDERHGEERSKAWPRSRALPSPRCSSSEPSRGSCWP